MNKIFFLIFLLSLSAQVVYGQETAASKPEILATDMSFDLKTGEIRYTLPEPALVRVRIGFGQGGALLINLLDWERREAGPHVETWDFKDETGSVSFEKRDDIKVVLACIPVTEEEQKIYQSTIKGFRKSPHLDITFPESALVDGIPVFKNMDPVRTMIAQEDAKWLTETKYEVGIFINTVFLTEDEEGINPYTYRLNTKGLREGLHTITVNVVSYEGEIGTKSVLVKIVK